MGGSCARPRNVPLPRLCAASRISTHCPLEALQRGVVRSSLASSQTPCSDLDLICTRRPLPPPRLIVKLGRRARAVLCVLLCSTVARAGA
jgi:hypothetical protein